MARCRLSVGYLHGKDDWMGFLWLQYGISGTMWFVLICIDPKLCLFDFNFGERLGKT